MSQSTRSEPRETILPFEKKYSTAIREQSLAHVLERRLAEPGNRAVIRETAAQFGIGEQSLRGWIRAHERANAPATAGADARAAGDDAETGGVRAGRAPAGAAPADQTQAGGAQAGDGPAGSGSGDAAFDDTPAGRIAALEAEVARLRRDREALKTAMAVVLVD